MSDEEDDSAAVNAGEVLNNPAGRLKFWLEAGRVEAETQPSLILLDLWHAVWGLDPADREDRIEYTQRTVGLVADGAAARRTAQNLSETNYMARHALQYFDQVERALDLFMDYQANQASTMFGRIKETGWHSLAMLDSLLGQESPQPSLLAGQARELMERTRALMDAVLESDLDEADKMSLFHKLVEVDTALVRARVTGSATVVESVDGLAGTLFRVWMTRGQAFAHHPVAKGILALASAISVALGMGADYSVIASIVGLPLPGGTSPSK